MRNALLVLLGIICLIFESCDSDFNINAPYQNIYTLNCILRNDTDVQYALIAKNYYTENGGTPAPNSIDQNIKGVNIKISINDSVFVMRDTTVQVTKSGNDTPINCYYVKNLALNPGNVVRIEALVPDGSIVKSTIEIPQISYADFSPKFPQVFSFGYFARPYYIWHFSVSTEKNPVMLNLPQLELNYKKYEYGTWIDKKVLVPLALNYTIDYKGTIIPETVHFSLNNYCFTTLDDINKTMQDISGNDPHKNNYIVTKVIFNVICLDPLLTKYYFASKTYSEDFTIKLRQTEVSNIERGKGIFGVYYKFSKSLIVDSVYVKSFGYQYDAVR